MKTELKAKFLQHILNKKKDESGFTLIELLVVIIIIGILSAIALPSFLNQAAKAKQSEAKSYVGAVNRAQQAHRIEYPQFASSLTILEIGTPSQTVNYKYAVISGDTDKTEFTAVTEDPKSLKSFAGGVVILGTGQTSAAACQTKGVTATAPKVTLDATAGASCAGTDEPMK
ncbi:type IV pilin-like G/H family protein [Nodularia spumigena]|uniref:type IV pilin-like G/H family protein n=1 Tax=Nodularia spumigena TaxID=70799 RepID=UPI00232DFFB4|nr:type IV pilin-like G/H family protein [Nodularia spumigena]MDB9317596.1 type IV pilin-like G/H family protein [Nodularia spumigena CS-590/01A]MDB9325259.1 type IV pilin-like G/H family protein [Nodularia spumigena CS-590/02]MDB9336660.1 type IV pilin-like G/H family protein [Nodularia spumigena CS-590/01]MDB9347875.1 type IV pilin-like G/H family protein [Nodularia spumigena CS-588/01]MDB9354255.1 type IV pilin-like G/H family protein [Nodularia spumigena CS-588/05]